MNHKEKTKMRQCNYQNMPVKIEAILDNRKFIIPPFQRDVVWSHTKKYDFIRNLLEGDPFGILLIKNVEDGRYKLVDGLQRITTIQEFNRNPFKYLDYKDINPDLVDKLLGADCAAKNLQVPEKYIKENREECQKIIFDTFKNSESANLVDLIPVLTNDFGLTNENTILHIIEEIVNDFKVFIDLNNLEVYAINYVGDEENLSTVFDNLNTGGMKLSKYDALSAAWFNEKFKVDDEDLIDTIVNRYKQLEKKSRMEVDYSRDDLIEEGINLHQYCRAIGTIITKEDDEFDILFNATDKLIEKVGFEIVSLLLVESVNGANDMYEKLKDHKDAVEGEFLVKLKNAVKESLMEITKALKPVLIGKNHSYLRSDRIYLTYHILLSYIKEYYDYDIETGKFEKKLKPELSKKKFKKYMPLHYIYDCITDYWKENRQVSDINKAVADKTRRQRYWEDISPDDWSSALDKFMNTQKSVGKSVPQQNKLFIDFLTQRKIKENPDYGNFFTEENISNKEYPLDIEHIVPKKVLQEHMKELEEEKQSLIPVSAVGNLCYLSVKDNRGKKHYTLHEYMEGRPSYVMNQDFQDCILYPTKEELKFKDYNTERFFEEYEKFINDRQEKLKKEFIRLIKKY